MRLTSANSFNNLTSSFNRAASLQSEENKNDQNSQTISVRDRKNRQSDILRIQRDKNEMKIREREDAMIQKIQDQIMNVIEADLDFDSRGRMVEYLESEIEHILTQRKTREEERLQLELKERKAEIEKERYEAEKARLEMNEKFRGIANQEDTEEALRREDIRNLVQISISLDSMSAFRQSRARMASEAGHLEAEIDNAPNGSANPNDFRNTQPTKLTKGIAGLDTSINLEIGKINDGVASWAANRNSIIINSDNDSVFNEKAKMDDIASNSSKLSQNQDMGIADSVDLYV